MITKTRPPLPPLARDVLDAIGEPLTPRALPSEAETGRDMRFKARAMVDAGEIRSEADAEERFRARCYWIVSFKGFVSPATLACWLNVEKQFFQSVRKYLRERNAKWGRV